MKKTKRRRIAINRPSIWRYLLLLSVLITSVVYALPNVYGNDPSILISNNRPGTGIQPELQQHIAELLNAHEISSKASNIDRERLLIRFHDVDTQFQAYDIVSSNLPKTYGITYLLASQSPAWLSALGASPMHLGLDLQGGVHLLYEVDTNEAVNKAIKRYIGEYKLALQDNNIRYTKMAHLISADEKGILIDFNSRQERDLALALFQNETPSLKYKTASDRINDSTLVITLPEDIKNDISRRALEKNISTLRNRADELGVSAPKIHKQGLNLNSSVERLETRLSLWYF